MLRAVVTMMMLVSLAACQQEKPSKPVLYKGPLATMRNITTFYTDSAQPKVELRAPVQNEYSNGNRTFPAGINILFYDSKGQPQSRLTANKGYYNRMSEIYTGVGNVHVENFVEKRSLRSEELKWSRFEKRVYTDKAVRIQTPEETLLGDGLTAAQDFTTYRILKLRATIPANKL